MNLASRIDQFFFYIRVCMSVKNDLIMSLNKKKTQRIGNCFKKKKLNINENKQISSSNKQKKRNTVQIVHTVDCRASLQMKGKKEMGGSKLY